MFSDTIVVTPLFYIGIKYREVSSFQQQKKMSLLKYACYNGFKNGWRYAVNKTG